MNAEQRRALGAEVTSYLCEDGMPYSATSSNDQKILAKWPDEEPVPEFGVADVGDHNAFPGAINTVYDPSTFEDDLDLTGRVAESLLYDNGRDRVVVNFPPSIFENGDWQNKGSYTTEDRTALFDAVDERVYETFRTSDGNQLRVEDGDIVYSGPDAVGSVSGVGVVNMQDSADALGSNLNWDMDILGDILEPPSGIWSDELELWNDKAALIACARAGAQLPPIDGVYVPDAERVRTLEEAYDWVREQDSPAAIKTFASGGRYGDNVLFAYPDEDFDTIRERATQNERRVRNKGDRPDDFRMMEETPPYTFVDREGVEAVGVVVEGIIDSVTMNGDEWRVLDYQPQGAETTAPVDATSFSYFDPQHGVIDAPSAVIRVSGKADPKDKNANQGAHMAMAGFDDAWENGVSPRSEEWEFDLVSEIERMFDRPVPRRHEDEVYTRLQNAVIQGGMVNGYARNMAGKMAEEGGIERARG